MKLGTQTASLTNHIYSRMTIGEPVTEVGIGATILHWSDRTPATVIAWDGKILTVQEDDATRTDANGMSECQDYEYTANPHGIKSYFRKDRSGAWVEVRRNPNTGRWIKCGHWLRIGERDKYYDFSF